jgi:hypothetical protein
MNTEINETFEDYSDDYATEAEGTTESVADRQGDATDAVAALLMGDESALDNLDGNSEGAFKMGHVRDTSSTRDDSRGQQAEPSYAGNQSAPDMQSAQARVDHFTQAQVDIGSQWEQLQQMQGDMTPEQFAYAQQHLQGQMAGATIALQNAKLEQMENQNWLSEQEAVARQRHQDIFADPQTKSLYDSKAIDALGKAGFSREELSEISGREYAFAMDYVKAVDERDQLKLQVAKLKQERRNHNQSMKKGRRDIEAGAGRSTKGGGDVYDEVARVLMQPRRG